MPTKKPSTIILSILLISSVISAVYFYNQNKRLTLDQNQAQADEARALVEAVNKLILLPDEAPTIATITDPKLLEDQAFFAKSNAGDKVLLFSSAHKVILYDPVANKIINIGSFNINKTTNTESVPEESTATDISSDES